MGGGKQGEPPEYTNFHKDFHLWMLTEEDPDGDEVFGGNSALGVDTDGTDLISDITGGAYGAFNAARATAIGQTPYAASNVFDPEAPGNRYDVLVEETDKYVEFVQNSVPETTLPENVSAIKAKIDLDYDATKFTADVTDFNVEQDIQRTLDLEEKNDIVSYTGDHAALSRSMMAFLMDEERDRASDQFSARLHYEHQIDRRNLTIEAAFETIDQDNVFLAVRSQAITALLENANLYGKTTRQGIEDELRLAVEDILWDSKLVDFMNKALGSITGVSILPQGAAGGNSTLNTIATVAGILGTIMAVAP